MRWRLRLKPHPKKTERYLEQLKQETYFDELDAYAREGVTALMSATPVDTGRTAASWSYEIVRGKGHTSIYWKNDNVTHDGQPIAILLQYGHGTGNGGYVVGRDYINPAIKPVFDKISSKVREAVVNV